MTATALGLVLSSEIQAGTLTERWNWRLKGSWITSACVIGSPLLNVYRHANEVSVIFGEANPNGSPFLLRTSAAGSCTHFNCALWWWSAVDSELLAASLSPGD